MTHSNKQREKQVSANGLTFHCREWGDATGRNVLLLHGFPQNAASWEGVAKRLAEAGYRVYAFDQRGYSEGAKPLDPESYNFEAFINDAVAVADGLKLGEFFLCGFGMGAAQAWMVAARYPERIKSLAAMRFPHPAAFAWSILNDPVQKQAWDEFSGMLGSKDLNERAQDMLADDAKKLREFFKESGLKEPYLSDYVSRMQEINALKLAFSWEGAMSLDVLAQTPPVVDPTIFIWSKGPAISENVVIKTKDYVKGEYEAVEIENVGNFILENASDEVADHLIPFWQKIE